MNLSPYLANTLLDYAFGNISPRHIYAGLLVALPTGPNPQGTELVANNYARVLTSWNAAASEQISNAAPIRFPEGGTATSNWGGIAGLALYDALTGGNLLWSGPLSAGLVISLGGSFQINDGNLIAGLS